MTLCPPPPGAVGLTGYQCFTIDEGRTDAEYVCGTLTAAKTVTNLERGLDPLTGTTRIALLSSRTTSARTSEVPLVPSPRLDLQLPQPRAS